MSKPRKALKPVLFAITKSKLPIYERPIGECLLVEDNSMRDLIQVRGSRFGTNEDGEAIIPRKDVLFYSHTDLRSAITELNTLVAAAHKEQLANVEALLASFQKVHETKERK